MAKDEKKADKAKSAEKTKAKTKGGKKPKKGSKARSTAGGAFSVATHPRASGQVRRAKGCGGIAGFAIAAYLSYQAHVPPEIVGLRALAAGIAGYMLAWACSVTVWRYVVIAELRAMVDSGRLVPEEPPAAPAPPEDTMADAVPEAGE